MRIIPAMVVMYALAAPAIAGMKEDCVQEIDRDLQISGCTAVIHSGQVSDTDLATAYYSRGVAYRYLGEHRQEIESYDQALRIDPGDAKAYLNRGVAYSKLGEYRQAIADYRAALVACLNAGCRR
jgi:tetratricopeptide (TPR) repeat protein